MGTIKSIIEALDNNHNGVYAQRRRIFDMLQTTTDEGAKDKLWDAYDKLESAIDAINDATDVLETL